MAASAAEDGPVVPRSPSSGTARVPVLREIRSYLKVRAKLLAGWFAVSLAVVTACWAILHHQEQAEVARFSRLRKNPRTIAVV
jgi:hypothetical protein